MIIRMQTIKADTTFHRNGIQHCIFNILIGGRNNYMGFRIFFGLPSIALFLAISPIPNASSTTFLINLCSIEKNFFEILIIKIKNLQIYKILLPLYTILEPESSKKAIFVFSIPAHCDYALLSSWQNCALRYHWPQKRYNPSARG